ncbi:hypothetical protein HPB50_020386 [Hyalomma asiaticum]|uniref:Uncharacterized protein n=1 Tax=Hyalomma asiaticum TaxID=266040 RepID=A0ACB7S1K5_HYAAI|nr:hypothetical protein HPB50_020386 [Hyalomma asiaticum]
MASVDLHTASTSLFFLLLGRASLCEDEEYSGDDFSMVLLLSKLQRHDRHRVPLYVESVVPTYPDFEFKKIVRPLQKYMWCPGQGVCGVEGPPGGTRFQRLLLVNAASIKQAAQIVLAVLHNKAQRCGDIVADLEVSDSGADVSSAEPAEGANVPAPSADLLRDTIAQGL